MLSGEGGIISLEGIRVISIFRHQSIRRQRRRWWQSPRGRSKVVSSRNRRSILRSFEYLLSRKGLRHQWISNIRLFQILIRQRRRWWQWPGGRSKVVSSRNRRSIRSFEHLLSRKIQRISGSAISAFSKSWSDKDEDRGDDQEEDQKLSPAETTVIFAHLKSSFVDGVYWWNGCFFTSADLLYARCFSFVKANIFAGEIAGVKDSDSWQTQRWPEWSARKEADWDMANFVWILTGKRTWRFSFRKAAYHWCFLLWIYTKFVQKVLGEHHDFWRLDVWSGSLW